MDRNCIAKNGESKGMCVVIIR